MKYRINGCQESCFQFKCYVNGGGVSVWAGNAEGWGSNIGAKVILECSLMRYLITTPPFIGHHDNAKSGGNRVRENFLCKSLMRKSVIIISKYGRRHLILLYFSFALSHSTLFSNSSLQMRCIYTGK